MRLKLLVLFFLLGCNDDMQFTQQGIICSKVPSGNAYTTADGKQVVWVVGDSYTVRRPTGSYGPTPTANTVFQWDVASQNLYTVGATDILQSGAAANDGSIWPQFGITLNTATGFKPVFVTSGVGGTNYAPRTGETDNWSTASTLYANSKGDLDDCLAYLGLEYPKYIVVICGLNDARGATALATVETEIQAFYTKVTTDYPNAQVLIYNTGRDENSVSNNRLSSVRKYLRDVVIGYTNCHYIGTFTHFWQAGLFLGDDLHLDQDGNNAAGEMFGRWFENSTYSKMPRAIIASHFGTLSTARKNLIQDWYDDLGADFFDLDFAYNQKTVDERDTYMDYTFLMGGYKTSSGFTTNSYITTNGTSSFWRPGFRVDYAINASQNDGFVGVKVATNRSAAGATRTAIGAGDSSGAIAVGQLNTSVMYYRFNDVTNSTYATDAKVGDDAFYVTARNAGNKYLLKNGSQVATAAVASLGMSDDQLYQGANNSNGTTGTYLDADFEYCVGGKYTTVDQSNLYTAFEALIDGW